MFRCLGVAAVLAIASCSPQETAPRGPVLVFPDAEPLKHRHRNYAMTESLDGMIRVYAEQKGDFTDLVEMRKQPDGAWSEPTLIELPKRATITTPRFSWADGRLYFSSDAQFPGRRPKRDMNIWAMALREDGTWGEPEVLPDVINTGAHEEAATVSADGVMIFSSTHPRGVGGFDLYEARPDPDAPDGWAVTPLPINSKLGDTHAVVSADGQTLFYYAQIPRELVYGNADLVMSRKVDGEWTAPVNLGPMVNTDDIDYGPGLSADGETFFFSQKGIMYEVALDEVMAQLGKRPVEEVPTEG
ncbi:MAG: hypothetical protein AAFX03_10890 [Pseudomonadota bacterium]